MEKAGNSGRDRAEEVAEGSGSGNVMPDITAAARKVERTEKAGSDRAAGRIAGKAKWTVMVYIAGDNNLDGAALREIEEMAQVGSTKDVNVLVQLDRLEDKKTLRFLITKGGGYERDCMETFG